MRKLVGLVAAVLVAAATAALPLMLNRSGTTVYILVGLYAIVAIGISLLMGYAGQVSIGQVAFYGIGAYTTAFLAISGWPPLVGLLLAPVVSYACAWLIGVPLLRLRGHYLAFGTLALLLILNAVISQVAFLGKATGLQGIPPLQIGEFVFNRPIYYAWVTWFSVIVVAVLSRNIIQSRPGRALRALATSEVAATSSGVPVMAYRRNIFALSGAFAGLAGGIYALFIGFISPASFTVQLSLQFVVIAVVGGLGTVWGPVIGAALVTLVLQILNAAGTLPGMPAELPAIMNYAAYALLLIGTILLLPRGIYPSIRDLFGRTLGTRPPNSAATLDTPESNHLDPKPAQDTPIKVP